MLTLPDFLYVGAAKSGSSWLYEILREHPAIYVPPAKDLQFFDRNYERGIEWYGGFFVRARPDQKKGELSHDYFFHAEYAARIHRHLPDVRIIACLREPVDRIVSHYHYGRTVFVNGGTTLEEFAASEKAHRGTDYLRNLRPFYSLFPRERILVMLFDDLKADPGAFVRQVYRFLGVDETFVPDHLSRPSRAARRTRIEWLGHRAYRVAQWLRRMGAPNLVGLAKRNPLVNRVLFAPPAARPTVSIADRERIRSRYLEDYPALEELIGRRLPAAWYGDV